MHYPAHQQIEFRAYELWEERGQPWGTPEIDWFQAEQELTEPNALSRVARQIGTVVGTVVAAVSDSETRQ